MIRILPVAGLATTVARDGWWLDDPRRGGDGGPSFVQTARGGLPRRVGLLLADLLLWQHALGLSLAIFAVASFQTGSGPGV